VTVAKISAELERGESGAWVVESHTLRVYGHLIAADAFGDGYIVPLLDTFTNIREKTGAEAVSLATSLDVAAMLGERLVPTKHDKGRAWPARRLSHDSSDEMFTQSATGDIRHQKDTEGFHDSGFVSAVPSPVAGGDRVRAAVERRARDEARYKTSETREAEYEISETREAQYGSDPDSSSGLQAFAPRNEANMAATAAPSRRPSNAEWSLHLPRIYDLYHRQRLTLEDTQNAIQQETGFYATLRMYKGPHSQHGCRFAERARRTSGLVGTIATGWTKIEKASKEIAYRPKP
jgi:hypothetical protein